MQMLWILLGATVATARVGAVDTSTPAHKPYIKAEGGNFVVSIPLGASALLQFHNVKTGEVETAPSAVSQNPQACELPYVTTVWVGSLGFRCRLRGGPEHLSVLLWALRWTEGPSEQTTATSRERQRDIETERKEESVCVCDRKRGLGQKSQRRRTTPSMRTILWSMCCALSC